MYMSGELLDCVARQVGVTVLYRVLSTAYVRSSWGLTANFTVHNGEIFTKRK